MNWGSRVRPPHALLTDEPGVVVHNPRQRLARLLVLYAVLPLICAAAGAYVAYELGNARTDRRIDALEGDLAQRRASRAVDDKARDARLEQTRRDLCVVVDRVQPRDAAVEDVRRRYGCTQNAPPSSPRPSARPVTPGTSGTVGGGAGRVRDRAVAPSPVPGPTGPQGPPGPTPPPPPPDTGGEMCLPVVGCLP